VVPELTIHFERTENGGAVCGEQCPPEESILTPVVVDLRMDANLSFRILEALKRYSLGTFSYFVYNIYIGRYFMVELTKCDRDDLLISGFTQQSSLFVS